MRGIFMNYKLLAASASHLMVKRFLGPFWFRRKWLNRTQWMSQMELQHIQLKLLKRLIRHCYKSVPYYRCLMDKNGIKVESINKLDDIKKFPVLTKKDVLAAGDSICSDKYPKWLKTTGSTGGTTGTPLSLPRNLFSVGTEHAFARRQWDWAGIGLLDSTAYLSGRVIIDVNQKQGPFFAYGPFMKELVLSNYHLSLETVPQFVEAMKRYRIKAIAGYTSSIYFLAGACRDLGLKIELKAALPTSETINEPVRLTIARAFECKVFDFYGAAERVCYIFTCEYGSYHIIPEYGLTELIPLHGPFEGLSKIVSTGFWNYAMPLIRYDTQDMLTESHTDCPCGRNFPVVESVCGRTGDVIRTPSGKEYAPTLLARVAKGAQHILGSQIIQDSIDHIVVGYLPGKQFSEEDLAYFKKHMTAHMPRELKIDFKEVNAVERTSNGKTNFVISRL